MSLCDTTKIDRAYTISNVIYLENGIKISIKSIICLTTAVHYFTQLKHT